MMASSSVPITQLLQHAAAGDRAALDAVFQALYPELKRVARARLYAQGSGGLGTTTLVHECFLRLVHVEQLQLQDRKHFFTYAAKTMRHVIIDEVRSQQAERHGGGVRPVTLQGDDAMPLPAGGPPDRELLAVHEALAGLEALDRELAELVEMRYFGGYLESEIAELLGLSERTVRRRWDKARSFLYAALHPDGEAAEPGADPPP